MHPEFCSMSWPEGLSAAKFSGMTTTEKIYWQDFLKSWMKVKRSVQVSRYAAEKAIP